TGYGNPLNVIRTVGAYEAAGVAGIHIEDQVAPKKCGHMDGKMVIPAGEMAAKIRAATEARGDTDFVIIARTDARAVEGFEQSLARAGRYPRQVPFSGFGGRMVCVAERSGGTPIVIISSSVARGNSGRTRRE